MKTKNDPATDVQVWEADTAAGVHAAYVSALFADLAESIGLVTVSSNELDALRDTGMRSVVSANSTDILTLAVVCALLESRAADTAAAAAAAGQD